MTRLLRALVLLALTGLWLVPAAAAQSVEPTLVVAPDGPYRSLAAALVAAPAGATITVRGGWHAGPLEIARPVTLHGIDWPVIDGGGQGSVVTITAPGTVLRGFVIRGSGTDLNAEDAGVVVRAARVTVADNRVEDVLAGIVLEEAPGGIVRHNRIRGKLDLPSPARGDGLKLWYSADALVEGNHVSQTRDCVIWYSARLRLIDNTVEYGRYGLHFMYDDQADLIGNVLRHNSVGAYLMYSRQVNLRGNVLANNRGPSGFGLGLKDVDDLRAEGNWLVDNRVGVWIDNSPTSLMATSRFERNVIAGNDLALTLQPSTERNSFVENVFRDNQQQISLMGGGTLRGNAWNERGRGNFWSDYPGFDADGDGLGDVPYRADGLIDALTDRRPELRLFQFSLAVGAVEFAARAFPALRPTPRLTDTAPLMTPPSIPLPTAWATPGTAPAAGLAVGLLGMAGTILALGRRRPLTEGVTAGPAVAIAPSAAPRGSAATPAAPVLRVDRLSRRFGRLVAVDDLSFAVAPGEIVALWGANGAGKTTAIRCILGLLPHQGRICVAGHDAWRDGRRARRALGYVAQEVALHDELTVGETLAFYARLKGVPPAQALPLLDELVLGPQRHQPVGTLSGGLRQRLALAIALIGAPPLLILDEPLSNLDAGSRELVLRHLAARRANGTAMLITSHRLEEIEALADRVIVLASGRLAISCAATDLASRLGLRLALTLQIAPTDIERALVVLQASGLTVSPNGRALTVLVAPGAKALPLQLLERAGVTVHDFSLEDGGRPALGGGA